MGEVLGVERTFTPTIRSGSIPKIKIKIKSKRKTMAFPPTIHPYFKKSPTVRARASDAGPWAVPELCAAYDWPTGLAGGGLIAIVELGGGWTTSDMTAYFASIHQPVPQIVDVSVDGTRNTPGGEADGEVALDIQVAAAAYYAATGKVATIRVYWARDIALAVREAVRDGCDVCSISWGADEADWGTAAARGMEQAAIEATAAGMVVLAASGDNDSSDGGPSPANIDLPAGCPHVIGCGGTLKTRKLEVVWNSAPGSPSGDGTGGGYSGLFPMPAWQRAAGAPQGPGRMVPDVAAVADPSTGYEILLRGVDAGRGWNERGRPAVRGPPGGGREEARIHLGKTVAARWGLRRHRGGGQRHVPREGRSRSVHGSRRPCRQEARCPARRRRCPHAPCPSTRSAVDHHGAAS